MAILFCIAREFSFVSPVSLVTKNARVVFHSDNYRVVWEVLQALRSHDNRFNAEINKLELNKDKKGIVDVIGVGFGQDEDGVSEKKNHEDDIQKEIDLFSIDNLRNTIYATIVKKCGDRKYWENWAADVAAIATTHIARITKLVDSNEGGARQPFDTFLAALQNDLNPQVTRDDAIEMLAQHRITRPVFNALFGNDNFVAQNPVSQNMQAMLELLDKQKFAKPSVGLEKFYESVRDSAEGIDNPEGKQKIIIELYDKFFRHAFPKMAERLGIVYTPVEVVDFIIHGVDDLLKQEFGKGITAENVEVLDPFTGTGTFITRLLESGLIKKADLPRKYKSELHANEIVLLAYYIAAINIEQAYRVAMAQPNTGYEIFEGILLTDTFNINETDADSKTPQFIQTKLPVNSARIEKQKNTKITVVFGNPPYSVGQKSANDDNKNIKYQNLDASIAATYVAHTKASLKKSLYDSYVRAIRWASDRIGDEGIVAYVSNGGYIDGGSMDGLRKCLREDFSSIYVLNLRGNIRKNMLDKTAGEGGNIFGQGSMTGIAILFMVKNPNAKTPDDIHYLDIGDDLKTEQKKDALAKFPPLTDMPWRTISPDKHNDWINQRNDAFESYLPLGDKENKKSNGKQVASVFSSYSPGMATSRDAWVYNFGKRQVEENIRRLLAFYHREMMRFQKTNPQPVKDSVVSSFVNNDATKISWSRSMKSNLNKGHKIPFDAAHIRLSVYRPFSKEYLYFNRKLNEQVSLQPSMFPTAKSKNLVICVCTDPRKEFSALMVNIVSDTSLVSASQCFPRHTFVDNHVAAGDAHTRVDNIPTATLKRFRQHYGDDSITGDGIFYYVYGVLHNAEYKTRYASDLKKILPRIPYAKTLDDFHAYATAGKQLADLHVGYEKVDPYPLKVIESNAEPDNAQYFRVSKMKYARGVDKTVDTTRIIYNQNITIENIPPAAQHYVVNGKPAIDWIIDRYKVSTHKDSQITNDANNWSDDHRYIIDLICKVTTVSVETVRIVNALPKLL